MTSRSVISVIIPTYAPDALLAQTISSVLAEARRSTRANFTINVTVVDDASPSADVEAIVAEADPDGRVELVRNECQLGLAGNWNRAIGLTTGDFIHLLHQDDYVLPTFYQRLQAGFQRRPDVGMAFCRTRIVDQSNHTLKTSSRPRWFRGVLSNWLWRIGERQRVQTPAVIVARNTYEKVGGYREDLCHTLDWEMWVRIAAHFPVWYDPSALAVYRRHALNESSRLLQNGAVWPDLARAIAINAQWFPEETRGRLITRSARWYLRSALRSATKQIRSGDVASGHRTLQQLSCLLDLLSDVGPPKSLLNRKKRLQSRLEQLRTAEA